MSVDSDAATRAALAGALVVAIKLGWPLFVRGLHRMAFCAGRLVAEWRERRSRGRAGEQSRYRVRRPPPRVIP